MDARYRKLLGAKAEVDCSPPRSLLTSVKYIDGQKRESAEQGRGPQTPSLTAHPARTPNRHATGKTRRPVVACSKHHQGVLASYCTPGQRALSGDVLDRHPGVFHRASQQPFTPRTHRKKRDSFLSRYRYYSPPKTQRKNTERQNRLSSRNNVEGRQEVSTQWTIEHLPDSGAVCYGREEEGNDEEEMRSLHFLGDVTKDILQHGFYSDSVLESVLSWHIMSRKHDLSKAKMVKLAKDFRSYLDS